MKKTFFICVKVFDRTAVQKLEGIGNKAYPFALYTLTSQRFRKLIRCAFLRVHADEYLRALGHGLEYLAGGFIGISVGKSLTVGSGTEYLTLINFSPSDSSGRRNPF